MAFEERTPYIVHPIFNVSNYGYDRNLANLISHARGNYVLLISDDDAFVPKALDKVVGLLIDDSAPFVITPYLSSDHKAMNRKYSEGLEISPGIEAAKAHLYDAILFSGLLFKRSTIAQLSADRFTNLNYFQVYLALTVLYRYGAVYADFPLIRCIGDGENGYGTTELSGFNPLLADRNNAMSNLAFNKGLVKVIDLFDADNGTNIREYFEREYSLRTYRGLSAASRNGRDEFHQYWLSLNSLDMHLHPIVWLYRLSLIVLGPDVSDSLVELPRRLTFAARRRR